MQETSTVVVRAAIWSHEGRKQRQCHPVPRRAQKEARKGIPSSWNENTKEKALTFVLSSFTATVLEGLFGEYHSSSAALGQQRPEVTKQPLTCDWSATSEALCDVNRRFARNTEVKFVQGVNTKTWLDYPCVVTAPKCRKRPP